MNFVSVSAVVGTALMILAPFHLPDARGVLMLLFGLLLLIPQSVNKKLWNLVTLNTIGVISYALTLARMIS